MADQNEPSLPALEMLSDMIAQPRNDPVTENLRKRVVEAESLIAKIKPLVDQLSELQWEVFESPHNHAVRSLRRLFP